MAGLAEPLEHLPVPRVALPVAHLRRARLEHRLQVVQDEQAAPRPQQLQELPQPRLLALGGQDLLGGEEQDGAGQPLGAGRGIAQAAPVHGVELRGQLVGEPGGEGGLADAAHAQDRHQAAAVGEHPVG